MPQRPCGLSPAEDRLAITVGPVRYPGIKIHDARIIRLLEVLLHSGSTVGGWTARQIPEAVVTTFQLSPQTYRLNQLSYDLRKPQGHALLERNGRRYAYRLSAKGVAVALLAQYKVDAQQLRDLNRDMAESERLLSEMNGAR